MQRKSTKKSHFLVPRAFASKRGLSAQFWYGNDFSFSCKKTHFHKKDCTLGLIFKPGVCGTRKWRIMVFNLFLKFSENVPHLERNLTRQLLMSRCWCESFALKYMKFYVVTYDTVESFEVRISYWYHKIMPSELTIYSMVSFDPQFSLKANFKHFLLSGAFFFQANQKSNSSLRITCKHWFFFFFFNTIGTRLQNSRGFFSKSVKKSVKCGVRVLFARSARRACEASEKSPQSRSLFSASF